jgi:arylsulfatase A-like enzyme
MDGVRDIEFVRAQYDAEVAYTDLCISHLINRLEELRLVDDTLLILNADHGEELDDHGCWFDHHGLYDTNVRVPLLMRLPGRLPAGHAVHEMTTLLDVAPTILDLLSLPEIAVQQRMPGRSVVALASGSATEPATLDPPAPRVPETSAFLTECTWMRKRGWRTPRWKLIRALEEDIYGKPPVELYDLKADPAEKTNIAESQPEVVAALTAEMEEWIERRMRETGLPDPLVAQSDALRIWQPRFIAGKQA